MHGNRTSVHLIVLAALVLVALACGPASLVGMGSDQNQPTVMIQSPAAGSSVPVNQPVTVRAAASDPGGPGVYRIDLLVNDTTVDTFEAGGPQATLAADLSFTPTQEGAVSVSVVAFRQDGMPSDPATIALTVVGATVEASSGGDNGSGGESSGEPSGDTSTGVRVEARADLQVNIRERPGPGCPIIGVWNEGDTGFFLEVTTNPTEYWYQTDYLGPNNIGWVYHDAFTLLGDDSVLPRVPEQGCLYCGDGICRPELDEACNTCEEDCGACCGNGVCEPEFGEECDICEPDCGTCVECGNGVVEEGEACDPPGTICYDENGAAGDCLTDCTCRGPF